MEVPRTTRRRVSPSAIPVVGVLMLGVAVLVGLPLAVSPTSVSAQESPSGAVSADPGASVGLGVAPSPIGSGATDPSGAPPSAGPSSLPSAGASPVVSPEPGQDKDGRHGRRKSRADQAAFPTIDHGVVSSIHTRQKVIAITIDDGGAPAVCTRMAAMLRKEDVPATFFPIGRNVQAAPGVWRSIARHFPLGNHTAFHAILPRIDTRHVERQILTDERFLEKATGKPPFKALRPPGGEWDARVQRIARSLGYDVLLLWDVTDADTAPNSKPSGMLQRALGGGPGSILLMHCNKPLSEGILRGVIDGYRERGYRFLTIPQMLGWE